MGMGQDEYNEWLANQGTIDAMEIEADRWIVMAQKENRIAQELGTMGFHRAQTDALARRNACLAIATKTLNGEEL